MSASSRYSLSFVQEEVRTLVHKGVLNPKKPIYTLCQYIPAREWAEVERELEENDFLLRDRIEDLISHDEWQND
jgi:hypothetical protein